MRDQYVSFSDDWKKSSLRRGVKVSQGIADANALVSTGSDGKLDNSLINWAAPGAIGGTLTLPDDLHPYRNPNRFGYLFDHFMAANGPFASSTTGTGSVSTPNAAMGEIRLSGGITPNGCGALRSGLSSMQLGLSAGLELDLFQAKGRSVSTQTALDTTVIRLGFANTEGAAPTNGLFFLYDRAQSDKWQCLKVIAAVTTTVVTTVAPVTNVDQVFSIQVAPGGTATFRIDGVVVATITGAQPTVNVGLIAAALKTLNLTAQSFGLDYLGGGPRQVI